MCLKYVFVLSTLFFLADGSVIKVPLVIQNTGTTGYDKTPLLLDALAARSALDSN